MHLGRHVQKQNEPDTKRDRHTHRERERLTYAAVISYADVLCSHRSTTANLLTTDQRRLHGSRD